MVENIYFSDHDAVRIVIEKNVVDFCTTPINPIKSGEEVIDFLGFFSNLNSFSIVFKITMKRDRQYG